MQIKWKEENIFDDTCDHCSNALDVVCDKTQKCLSFTFFIVKCFVVCCVGFIVCLVLLLFIINLLVSFFIY